MKFNILLSIFLLDHILSCYCIFKHHNPIVIALLSNDDTLYENQSIEYSRLVDKTVSYQIPQSSLIIIKRKMNHTLPSNSIDKQSLNITVTTSKLLKISFYFFLIYFFTVVYNVSNKRLLNALPLPASITVIQLLLGIPMFIPLWIAKPPRLYLDQLSKLNVLCISLAHGLGGLATTYALNFGSISFIHVIKSCEPVFTALLSGIILGNYYPMNVYMTLILIIAGVALASSNELLFSWYGFIAAMISNLFYQLRIVLSKKIFITNNNINRISASNLFRIITILSALLMLPIAIILEHSIILPTWEYAISTKGILSKNELLLNIFISGFSFYAYNEIAFWILDLVHPITYAIGNTIKRVILIIASVIIFKIPLSLNSWVGSIIAILGSFLYAKVNQNN